MTKVLVILSGGQDSTTALFWAKKHFDNVHAITFDYGQRHSIEIEAAKKVASIAQVETHEVVELPGLLHSTSPLTSDNELEQYKDYDQMDKVIGDRVELTFVPMRNTLFFTVAANRAVELGCRALITGICEEDNANYPDCTNEFRIAFQTMMNYSLGVPTLSFKVHAPLMFMDKADTVKLAYKLGEPCLEALAYSHTSYDGKYPPTDHNHSNVLRAYGFEKAGKPDPLVLRAVREGLMELPLTSNYDKHR